MQRKLIIEGIEGGNQTNLRPILLILTLITWGDLRIAEFN